MKAAVVTEFGAPIKVQQVPVPQIKHDEVLVKIQYTGMCGTDHHAWKGDWDVKPKLPLIPGHEGVGTVVKAGPSVKHVQVGDTVGIPWLHDACSDCEYCYTGWETLCHDQHNTGFSLDGTMAEYAVADPKYVARIPDGVDKAKVAPVLCAGLTVYKGLKMTQAKPGNWVMVTGLGGLGQLGVQFAQAMGYNVIGVDIYDNKLETAKRLGATHAFNGKTEDIPERVREVTGGGVHGIVVTAVNRAAFAQALGAVRRGGTMVCIGLPAGEFPLNIVETVLNGVTVRGSIVGTRMDMIEALEFFREGKIQNEVILDSLDNVDKNMQLMDAGKLPGRVVFDLTK